jgi:hypothetical protein
VSQAACGDVFPCFHRVKSRGERVGPQYIEDTPNDLFGNVVIARHP